MGWFNRHRSYPKFYEEYLEKFKDPRSTIDTARFVVFDTETTGLNPSSDRILSIGTVGIQNFEIDVSDSFECYLQQAHFNATTVEIHGILKTGKIIKIEEQDALIKFLAHIGNAVLVAHHAAFDIAMINEGLKRMNLPKLKNKVVDTGELYRKTKYIKDNQVYSLDALCDLFKITKHDRHTASGDAFLTALIFLKTIALLRKKKRSLKLRDLTGWMQ